MRRPAAPEARQNPRRQASAVATTHTSPDAKAGPVGPLRKQPEFRDEQVSLHLPCRRSARAAAYGAPRAVCGNAFANANGPEVADGRHCDRQLKGLRMLKAFVRPAAERAAAVPGRDRPGWKQTSAAAMANATEAAHRHVAAAGTPTRAVLRAVTARLYAQRKRAAGMASGSVRRRTCGPARRPSEGTWLSSPPQ